MQSLSIAMPNTTITLFQMLSIVKDRINVCSPMLTYFMFSPLLSISLLGYQSWQVISILDFFRLIKCFLVRKAFWRSIPFVSIGLPPFLNLVIQKPHQRPLLPSINTLVLVFAIVTSKILLSSWLNSFCLSIKRILSLFRENTYSLDWTKQ